MNVSRATASLILEEAQEALEEIAGRHGMVIAKRRATYGDSLRMTFDLALVDLDEQGINRADPSALDFERYAGAYGLPSDALGKEFTTRQGTYVITGLNPKARRYPINVKRVPDGAPFRFPAESVVHGLERAGAMPTETHRFEYLRPGLDLCAECGLSQMDIRHRFATFTIPIPEGRA